MGASDNGNGGADDNVERMREYERVRKLSTAVDAVVARQFAVGEKEKVLVSLETRLGELEQLLETAEESSNEAWKRCAILRADGQAGGSGALAGTNAEVRKLYEEYGEAMMGQLLRHWDRLEELQRALE